MQGGIANLNKHFNKEYVEALQDLAEAEARLQKRLAGKLSCFCFFAMYNDDLMTVCTDVLGGVLRHIAI